jgi:putative endonuclease
MYFVYILQSEKDGRYYIGSSKNVFERLERHNRGEVKATKYRKPFKIVFVEEHETSLKALRREKEIKSYKGGQAFKKLINGE